MIRKLIKNRNGEGYVDMCVGVIVFVMILVIAINIFSFITLRIEMDQIADEILEASTYSGCFGDDSQDAYERMLDEYYDFDLNFGADEYFNSVYRRVQLGHVMWVEVSVTTNIKGLGVFEIPVTLTVHRSGLSQKYWK
ncbi:MAG: DUF4320 family protein [Clostridia bacterium]|nr:DUF4320 family protein [Clostridia bacterium]